MRLLAISDVHVDYPDNARWVEQLSNADYRDDILILAGDMTEDRQLLSRCLGHFAAKFRQVLFVPGNHDLWVRREPTDMCSLRKFDLVVDIARNAGVSMSPYRYANALIVPLLGWYDYSFSRPDQDLEKMWMDYRACRWPDGFDPPRVTEHFLGLNPDVLPSLGAGERIVTFSHFLPRIDLIPSFVPGAMRRLDPVLGSTGIERQLRALGSHLHVYGHSHINRHVRLDGVTYINNAFGYPQEGPICRQGLIEITNDASLVH